MSYETQTMTVSMDGIRKNAARSYSEAHQNVDNLLYELEGNTQYDDLIIEVKDAMNSLNSSISSLLCVYSDEEENFSDLSSEIDDLLPEQFDME